MENKISITKKIIAIALMFMLAFSMISAIGFSQSESFASASSMVKQAKKYNHNSARYFGFRGGWCGKFVAYCAKKSGNKYCIYTKSGSPRTIFEKTVNTKGGTIVFVNKRFYKKYKKYYKKRCKYKPNYKPRKGDLIMMSRPYKLSYSHIGIVSKNSKSALKKVPIIDGNASGKRVNVRTFTSGTGHSHNKIVAYVIPKY
ncbi:MAG: CHAP domain-containing protein [Clostridia bacterium]|nr:CHAP domain-containing protein [Clostridia bacterium]